MYILKLHTFACMCMDLIKVYTCDLHTHTHTHTQTHTHTHTHRHPSGFFVISATCWAVLTPPDFAPLFYLNLVFILGSPRPWIHLHLTSIWSVVCGYYLALYIVCQTCLHLPDPSCSQCLQNLVPRIILKWAHGTSYLQTGWTGI